MYLNTSISIAPQQTDKAPASNGAIAYPVPLSGQQAFYDQWAQQRKIGVWRERAGLASSSCSRDYFHNLLNSISETAVKDWQIWSVL